MPDRLRRRSANVRAHLLNTLFPLLMTSSLFSLRAYCAHSHCAFI
ncbi:hypothetical protein CFter6_1978 [Collimonas fungivorans]|uniref:Uncharacterized protein n=1 Tax=Collimonas fungivorans TaxID=158899 RepID=A0A127PA32_9BURK|nr:hypothetical protein CFter6_1978 [Collimonas fungivorans]